LIDQEQIKLIHREGKDFNNVNIPIGQDSLDLLQSASSFTFILGERRFTIPLNGSRSALTQAIERVNFDIVTQDDRQHDLEQTKSDDDQPKRALLKPSKTAMLTPRMNGTATVIAKAHHGLNCPGSKRGTPVDWPAN
jgi:hypothetical protein